MKKTHIFDDILIIIQQKIKIRKERGQNKDLKHKENPEREEKPNDREE